MLLGVRLLAAPKSSTIHLRFRRGTFGSFSQVNLKPLIQSLNLNPNP